MFSGSFIAYTDILSALAEYWDARAYHRVLFCSDCGYEAYLTSAPAFAASVAACEFGDGGEGLDILYGFVFEGMSLVDAVAAYLDANCSICSGADVEEFDFGEDLTAADPSAAAEEAAVPFSHRAFFPL